MSDQLWDLSLKLVLLTAAIVFLGNLVVNLMRL